MHPRLIPSNGDYALERLRGEVDVNNFVVGEVASVAEPVVDLLRAPDGGLDCQLLYGMAVTLISPLDLGGHVFVQSCEDGYCGYVQAAALGLPKTTTHRVSSLATHAYPIGDIKSRSNLVLPMGSIFLATEETAEFVVSEAGWIPVQHVVRLDESAVDAIETARQFLAVPYLWGGNSYAGIDCSGLVQRAFASVGISVPRDSDMQATMAGDAIPDTTSLKRSDLVFWRGHVGLMADDEMLIHANAFHMSVTCERLVDVAARIRTSGGGEITARRRI
jgi:cell wall-associated NlpC family hydrolase